MALARQGGRVGGGCHQAPGAVGSPPAQRRVGGEPGLGVPVAEGPGHRVPVAGIIRPAPGQGAGRVDRGVRVRAVGPGAAARLEGHHERQPGVGELAAEPVLVAVGAVRATARKANPASRALTARSAPIASLVRNAGSFLPFAKCRAGV